MVGPGTRHGCPPPVPVVRVKIWISGNLEPRQVQAHEVHQVSSFPGFQPLPGRCVLAGILPRHDAPRDRNASPPVARRGFQFRLLPQGTSEFHPGTCRSLDSLLRPGCSNCCRSRPAVCTHTFGQIQTVSVDAHLSSARSASGPKR